MEKSLFRFRKRSPIRPFLILIAMAILMVAGVSAFADQNTFTNLVTTAPCMAGFVGRADGNGSYAGGILKYTEGTITEIELFTTSMARNTPFCARPCRADGNEGRNQQSGHGGVHERQPCGMGIRADYAQTIPER
jgi:hypothetical protein